MKVLHSSGLISLPRTSPTGKLLWVDSVYGNNSLALRESLGVPFKTLTAAKTAAQSGDTIMVLPGTYDENNLLKNGVNWHFYIGAVITYTGGNPAGIFDTGSNGTNGAVSCAIRGDGVFQNPGAYVVNSAANGSNLEIHGRALVGGSEACVRVAATASLRLKMSGHIIGGGEAILIAGGSTENFIEADSIHTSNGVAVQVSSGGVHVKARTISSASSPAIHFDGEDSNQSVFEAYEIRAESDMAIKYVGTGPLLTVIGARIISQFADATGYAIGIDSEATDVIKLSNCLLLVPLTSGPTGCIGSTEGVRVHNLNGVSANKDKDSNVTVLGPALTVSADFT